MESQSYIIQNTIEEIKRMILKRKSGVLFSIILSVLFIFESVFQLQIVNAEESKDGNTLKYYLGEAVNTGKDNGYSKSNSIKSGDVHFGWKLGNFYVSGYTRATACETDNPVFLKNVGDKVVLKFELNQDITKLNNKKNLYIAEDKNGYDNAFGIEKTNFGHGMLIIKHTDYQNKASEPQLYKDFLKANASTTADTTVQLCEEGDYEVTLDYEINDKGGPFDLFDNYSNYKIAFKFSVRNGNCMVYPFDVVTKAELTNSSITENGFYLDLAQSRYLDINVKKEVINEGKDGLVEDTRFNRPAKDGDKYTEEGIYTITAKNNSTNQETVKKIYVGKDNVMKASVLTDIPISEINKLVSQGAVISDDGTIIPASNVMEEDIEENGIDAKSIGILNELIIGIATGIVILILILILFVKTKNKKATKENTEVK